MTNDVRRDESSGASDKWLSTRVGGVQIGAYVSEVRSPKSELTFFWTTRVALSEFTELVSVAERTLGENAPDRVLIAYGETKETHRTNSLAERLAVFSARPEFEAFRAEYLVPGGKVVAWANTAEVALTPESPNIGISIPPWMWTDFQLVVVHGIILTTSLVGAASQVMVTDALTHMLADGAIAY